MVALSGLTTASTLLQQIGSRQGTASRPQGSTVTLVQPALGTSGTGNSAAKSVSSAIFNAVTDATEKQDASIKAVLAFIDRDYTNVEQQDANFLKVFGNDPSVQAAYAQHKAAGEALRQEVLADPAKIHKLLEQVRASRPEVSLNDAIGLLIAELGSQKSRQVNSGR